MLSCLMESCITRELSLGMSMVCKGRSERMKHFTVTRFAVTRLKLNGYEPRIHGLIATTRH